MLHGLQSPSMQVIDPAMHSPRFGGGQVSLAPFRQLHPPARSFGKPEQSSSSGAMSHVSTAPGWMAAFASLQSSSVSAYPTGRAQAAIEAPAVPKPSMSSSR